MKYIEFDGDRYKLETDISGSLNQLSRYNKNQRVHISLCFADTENPALIAVIKNDLKDIFVSRIRALANKK